ncbi:hypothetical protein MNBD_ALPHA04-1533 [hydrothermal vent metagenome]|uniref:Histidine kinase n=1 Tax=hydrothermal vent metagenome TaxID=652676 RepID=A0A3B0S4Z5_9ZZZZ
MTGAPSAEQILSGLPGILLVIDQKHRITKLNPAAEAYLGTSAKRIIGDPISSHFIFDDERVNQALDDPEANLTANRITTMINGYSRNVVDFDIHPLTADPRWRIISLSLQPADDPISNREGDHPDQFSIRAPDILGHEIKNPLAAIKGAAQLLDRSLDDDQKALTAMIKSEVERIASLLDRMQSLSANQPAQIESVNVHSLIDRARQSIEAAWDGKLELSVEYDPSLPDVLVDPETMMQVLTNLLSNAVEATLDVTDPAIHIITRYSFGASFSSHGDEKSVRLPVEIIIRDNGPGVPPNLENDIFSPFVTTKTEGQGLGLALVKKLIADMNGRIRYERDQQNLCTQFITFLPIAK